MFDNQIKPCMHTTACSLCSLENTWSPEPWGPAVKFLQAETVLLKAAPYCLVQSQEQKRYWVNEWMCTWEEEWTNPCRPQGSTWKQDLKWAIQGEEVGKDRRIKGMEGQHRRLNKIRKSDTGDWIKSSQSSTKEVRFCKLSHFLAFSPLSCFSPDSHIHSTY